MAGEGGFDGAPVQEQGTLEDAIAAAGAAPAEEQAAHNGAAEQQQTPAEQQATADWRAGLDEETRALVDSKGFRSPADLVRWGREAERTMHQTRQEYEAMQAQIAQAANGNQPQQPEGLGYTEADVFAAMETGDIGAREAAAYMQALREHEMGRLRDEFRQEITRYDAERVQPLGQVQAAEMLRGEIQQVQAQVGQEELQRYGEQAIQIRQQLGVSFQDAYALAKGRAETQRMVENRRAQYAETANGGARGRVPAKSDAEILAEEIFGGDQGPRSGGFD